MFAKVLPPKTVHSEFERLFYSTLLVLSRIPLAHLGEKCRTKSLITCTTYANISLLKPG